MRVVEGLDAIEASGSPAFVVVGVFDGLHLGHAYLLEHLAGAAAERDAHPVVVTFDHHPDEVLTGSAPPLLCDPAERLERLAAAGVGTTVVVHFDQALRETPYDRFVDRLEARTALAGFLMTPDAAFGYQRAGTPESLGALGDRRGWDVVVVPAYEIDGRAVRSTQVRDAIAEGNLDAAARLLGRPHAVVGESQEAGEGSVLRFPLPVALPPDGRYAARVVEGSPEPGRAPAAVDASGGVDVEAVVARGVLTVPMQRRAGRTRVVFTARR